MSVGRDFLQGRRPAALWLSSGLFSLLVLTGYEMLHDRAFSAVLVALALVNVLVATSRRPPISPSLLLSQSCIVLATVTAVLLYLMHYVGVDDNAPQVLADFLTAALADQETYFYFLGYSALFIGLVTLALYLGSALFRLQVRFTTLLAALYSASAVNLASDYSLRRPLFHVSGDLEATSFFFAAGLFGFEFSMPLHLILLVACSWAYLKIRKRAGDPAVAAC